MFNFSRFQLISTKFCSRFGADFFDHNVVILFFAVHLISGSSESVHSSDASLAFHSQLPDAPLKRARKLDLLVVKDALVLSL